jgi:pyruvate,orthophosphate dikinase
MTQWVYNFGTSKSEGNATMRNLLGGKGANLAEMSNLGLPVPPGFTVTTEVCTHYYDNGKTYPAELEAQVEKALAAIESETGRKFGDAANPLLVSVRSGARVSMPGMMDTVLNLGLNDATVAGMAAAADARFAWDSYRRFIQMYGDVVLGIGHYIFEEELEILKDMRGVVMDTDLSADDWRELVGTFKAKIEEELGRPFPQDPREQLWGAVSAVFASWQTPRAVTYRRLNDISEKWGTAVNVQAMVFGNMGETSATGVAFTRNPSTGVREVYGEYLVNAQGEDVVAGIRTPQHITVEAKNFHESNLPAMEEVMPDVFGQLCEIQLQLENHYRDMQDIEFTVERGRLWMLQTRSGKRTAAAALRIAVDMVNESLITRDEAVSRIEPSSLDQMLHPALDPDAERTVLGHGLPASPGAVSGAVVFSADEAEKRACNGEDVILVRIETSPEDIHGMHAAKGILTSRGGMTSHAAVVARGMGRPCVAGAGDIRIDYEAGQFYTGDHCVKAGETITLDGSTGEIMAGLVKTIDPKVSDEFATIMGWADEARRLGVRANAETPADARTARTMGAEGIGLCRTEHMFFDADRITGMREMIMAENEAGRRKALAKLLPMQRADFAELFRIMAGLPVTIRLLDPPLHEFLPHQAHEIEAVAAATGSTPEALRQRMVRLEESNPMLGHRGCRLGISFPEITEMQARAMFEAAAEVAAEGIAVLPEIMVPLVATKRELDILKAVIDRVAGEVAAEKGTSVDYMVGTMIELPRAALRGAEIAESAEFFSFGTNDLTQTTFGISRDDAASFLDTYQRQGIVERDPFVGLDQDGVGELVEMGATRGRSTRPNLKLGICGEHGGDSESVAFCHRIGLDYVSCSPYRVPIARLAAAQAAIAEKKQA